LVATAIAAANEHSVDLLSLSPFQGLGSFWERLVVPVGLVLIGCAMDLRRIDDPAAPDVSASGQFLLFAATPTSPCAAMPRCVARSAKTKRWLAGSSEPVCVSACSAGNISRGRACTPICFRCGGFSKNAVELLGNDLATVTLAMSGLILSWTAAALRAWSALVLVGGPSAPVVLGFGLCVAGSLAVLGVHLGTAWHCRILLWYDLLSPASYTAVATLAWSSLVLRRSGHVKWKGRIYNVVGRGGPGPL
jgi:chlorobactene glucosyltransferase